MRITTRSLAIGNQDIKTNIYVNFEFYNSYLLSKEDIFLL